MEAKHYLKKKNFVQCGLCPHYCVIKENYLGFCKVRKNIDGKLISLVYGKIIALNVDPIEKKPLYHFFPGEKVFSFGTVGCNLKCNFCQNWEISQVDNVEGETFSPNDLVNLTISKNCKIIAATYNEPTIFFEFMLDVFKLAKKKNLKTVVVSNGFINEKPLKELIPYVDAFNIDLKSFNNDFYKKFTKSNLNSVLETLKIIKQSGKWLEITNLIIPSENDSEEEIKKMCLWVKENLNVPLHFSAFYPMYKLNDIPQTSKEILFKCKKIAEKIGLKYIYLGNINEDQITYCDCGNELIVRKNYFITKKEKKCNICHKKTDGIM
jgi:pyruvate formate lyase activating enzyme